MILKVGILKKNMQIGSKVSVENGKVFRAVESIDDAKRILQALDEIGDYKDNVVATQINSELENILEHDYIPRIIHSGEFTESMAYDVNKVALDLNSLMYKQGVYSFDLLPHNFTFYNGKWILFDFGAFEYTSANVKTLIRNFYKISFSSFELLKIVDRKRLKHYFLNRIRTEKLRKMIPIKNWLGFFIESQLALLFCAMKLHRFAYKLVESRFKKYYFYHNRALKSKFVPCNEEIFNVINDILSQKSIKTTFGLGSSYANWAVSAKDFENFAYIDDYSLCDEFYNYIYQNNIKNVSTAVLYPLVCDDEINKQLNYRALYDSYAQQRFESQACLVLDFDELTENKAFNLVKFSEAVSKFATELLIIRLDNSRADKEKLKEEFENLYEKTSFIKNNEIEILVCVKLINTKSNSEKDKQYDNDNRMQQEAIHTEKIIEILQNKKL